ncbi:MAG: FAD-binding protein [Bacteroidales bacterium]|nr:FAD-binding protein [Bacteroidales bacterium]
MSNNQHIPEDLENLRSIFSGDIFLDEPTRILYATDASAYREIPEAVALPRDRHDVRELIEFAKKHNTSLIARTAGTSLAGQVVGNGIVVDFSKYMNRVIELNKMERWVTLEPGVILDELNLMLKPHGLYFSPETSTSNRCMIGGMVGNNSCGAHALVDGSTRDHLISVKAVLSDSSEVEFGPLSREGFEKKCELNTLEGALYRNIEILLSDPEAQDEIRREFPHPEIKRRNTGYAIDQLLNSSAFSTSDHPFNFSKMLAGSEGTLAMFYEFKLSLDPLPPPVKGLVCVHFNSLEEALEANLVGLQYNPVAIELMDRTVMEMSKKNILQAENRFFIKDDPAAILIIEFVEDSEESISKTAKEMIEGMKKKKLGYHYPLVLGEDISKVWEVRKAGLGLLSNMPGDAKPVAVVEDTAVRPVDLPQYISEFKLLLEKYKLKCAYNAHIATGELHLRPILNLKNQEHVKIFHTIARETALLVKKYRGSLSGEHGDGRLRGEFVPLMIGEKNFQLLWKIKLVWDPENIFNSGKLFKTPVMNTGLRYEGLNLTPEFDTIFDFSTDGGYLRSIEKCNGSGDCRKPVVFNGAMCPSFQATLDEDKTTRARANLLREILSRSIDENPFDNLDLYKILDLCLSCKACKSECPSNIDMAKIKAEFLQQYYKTNSVPFRSKIIANLDKLNKWASKFPAASNYFLSNAFTSNLIKKSIGFSINRNLPKISKVSLGKWYNKHNGNNTSREKKVFLFADEFTEYNDTRIGIKAIQLLNVLGYNVVIPEHVPSGRSLISKGLLNEARNYAEQNVNFLKSIITDEIPLIGIEPSAILTFRDEYPDLLRNKSKEEATVLAKSVFLIEEFIVREFEAGNISMQLFTKDKRMIKFHGHCYQKSLSSVESTLKMLSIPENYFVEEIPSGCCGMAGAFGYEKEHFELSMKIGNMILFPEIMKTPKETLIAANGTSCRCQIKDGTDIEALHPIEILFDALIQNN